MYCVRFSRMPNFNASPLVNKPTDTVVAIPSKKDKVFIPNNDDILVYGSFHDTWHLNKRDREDDQLNKTDNQCLRDINNIDIQREDDPVNRSDFNNNGSIISFMNSQSLFEQETFFNNKTPPLDESGFFSLDDQNVIAKNTRQYEKGTHHDTAAFKSPFEFAFDRVAMHDGENFHKLNIDGKIPSEQPSIVLSSKEQKMVDDFVAQEKGPDFFRNSGSLDRQKAENFSLIRSSYFDVSVHAEQTRIIPYFGGSISLTPFPIIQQKIMPLDHKLTLESDVGEINLNDVQERPILAEPIKMVEDSSTQNKMNFGQPQQTKSIIQEQTCIIDTTLSEHYVAFEFVAQIKEQFQKFQKGQDKKVTVHMRDGRKNLTMVMKMNNQNGLDLTFRTSDTAWADVLEKNKNYIEEELNKLNDGHQQIGIYYTGDSL